MNKQYKAAKQKLRYTFFFHTSLLSRLGESLRSFNRHETCVLLAREPLTVCRHSEAESNTKVCDHSSMVIPQARIRSTSAADEGNYHGDTFANPTLALSASL